MTQRSQFALAEQIERVGAYILGRLAQDRSSTVDTLSCHDISRTRPANLAIFSGKQRVKSGTDPPKTGKVGKSIRPDNLENLFRGMDHPAMIEMISRDAIFAEKPKEFLNHFKLHLN